MTYEITIDGKQHRLDLSRADGLWSCRLDGREVDVDAILVMPGVLSLRLGNRSYEVRREMVAGETHVWVGSSRFTVEVRDPRSLRGRLRSVEDHGPRKITAPMPGKIVRVLVASGAEVEAGEGILVVEAMKMQNEIKSPKDGCVLKICVAEGATVANGEVLIVVG